VECFGNRSVRELYERSIYERSFTSEPSIEKYQAKFLNVFETDYELQYSESYTASKQSLRLRLFCMMKYMHQYKQKRENILALLQK